MTDEQSEHLKGRFLQSFMESGNVSLSCRVAKVGRTTVYDWKKTDDNFRKAYEEAELIATESLEAEAWRRAVKGVPEPVYQGGKKVGAVRKFSDTLLIFLLKARAPEKYRDRYDVTSAGQPLIKAYEGVDTDRV